jgi:hypothetical protein
MVCFCSYQDKSRHIGLHHVLLRSDNVGNPVASSIVDKSVLNYVVRLIFYRIWIVYTFFAPTVTICVQLLFTTMFNFT